MTPEELHRIFYATRFGRKLDRAGYVRFRHWRLYGECGLAGDAAAVWLYGETPTVSFADEALAQYTVSYQPDRRQLAAVAELEVCETLRRCHYLIHLANASRDDQSRCHTRTLQCGH